MSKHTPGPWKLDREVVVDREDLEVATVDVNQGKWEANARLIAAAPELLEALRWMAQTVHQSHHEGELETCRKATCVAARDAAAKAEGER